METPPPGRRIWFVAVIGVLLIAAVVSYFVGGEIERSAGARVTAVADQRIATSEIQVASLRSANALLAANVWAYRATAALDERNFGQANDAAVNVVAGLSGVDAAASGINSVVLKSVQAEAASIKISVAADLQAQRGQLLHLAADITDLAALKSGKRP